MDPRTALVTFIISLTAAKQEYMDLQKEQQPFQKPSFCNDIDCPAFTSRNFTTFEEREYVDTMWVTTTQTGMEHREASRKMFMRLFRYIQGENTDKMKIAMTAPVKMRVIPGPGPTCENNFTMSFFISNKVTNPPQPTEDGVFLEGVKSERFYVRSFPGYARKIETWLSHAEILGSELKRAGKTNFDDSVFYTAGYDSPYRVFDRHNEVWFKITDALNKNEKPLVADSEAFVTLV